MKYNYAIGVLEMELTLIKSHPCESTEAKEIDKEEIADLESAIEVLRKEGG